MGKIRITDAKVNKKLIGDEVTYQKVSTSKINPTKGRNGGDKGHSKPKQPSLRDIVVQFIVKQEAFNNEVVSFIKEQRQVNDEQKQFNVKQEQFNAKQEQFNNEQKEFNKRIETKVDNLENKVNNVINLNNLKS
ncbi:MAG: hypothetical protein LBB45_03765 [Methanobrevibacter sp.]|jgi:hypothetical protein|nr:hypothetical protein [Candidatus Methanovirga basalitermitum]